MFAFVDRSAKTGKAGVSLIDFVGAFSRSAASSRRPAPAPRKCAQAAVSTGLTGTGEAKNRAF
jgi:hypothetical protein